ncbi:hypothetical protein [Streptomyces sp. NPDC005953]|uniref:hypothetical protein n=1 Tax=Streptomyces sp. NPDC005953 TaxID=3156719 RepID=UPI0033D9F169
MATTPETRDQDIADLRAALSSAAPWLSFAAGLVAADHPEQTDHLMAEAGKVEEVLRRTASE